MTIQRDIRDNKIQRNLAGEVQSSSAAESSEILHVDGDDQLPNRTHKNATNQVSQFTDKAQNRAFIPHGSVKPVFNYEGFMSFDLSSTQQNETYNSNPLDLNGDWTMIMKVKSTNVVQGRLLFQVNWDGANKGTGILANGSCLVSDSNGVVQVVGENFITDLGALGLSCYIILEKKGDKYKQFIRGKVDTDFIVSVNGGYYQATSDQVYSEVNDKLYLCGYHHNISSSGQIDIYNATILQGNIFFDSVPDEQTNQRITTVEWLDNFLQFTYHKRYKDGELYLSSKYLKDAVIDSDTNEITSIRESLKDTEVISEGTNNPTLTKQGIQLETTNTTATRYLKATTYQMNLGGDNFYIGGWFNFDSIGTYFWLITQQNYTGMYFELVYGKPSNELILQLCDELNSTIKIAVSHTPTYRSWNYYSVHRYGNNIYLCCGGVVLLVYILPTNFNLFFANLHEYMHIGATDRLLQYGSTMNFDDIFITKENVVNTTGYNVGQKVFEPPRRGGFNSDIKQY